jgi:hypothetical protein
MGAFPGHSNCENLPRTLPLKLPLVSFSGGHGTPFSTIELQAAACCCSTFKKTSITFFQENPEIQYQFSQILEKKKRISFTLQTTVF